MRSRRKVRLSHEKKNRVYRDWKRMETERLEREEARAIVREALRSAGDRRGTE